jgi:hypothetical protein
MAKVDKEKFDALLTAHPLLILFSVVDFPSVSASRKVPKPLRGFALKHSLAVHLILGFLETTFVPATHARLPCLLVAAD